jgi:hypothetical protein
MPRPIWTCDAETDPFEQGVIPQPFVWGVYTGSEYHEFPDAETMVNFLRDHKVICYAHNGGKFDYHYMLEHLEPESEVMLINGRLAKFKIGQCEFRDSFNILPVSLATFQKEKIDYAIFKKGERNKPHNRRAISKYLQSDCVNLHNVVSAFVSDFGLHLTQAGCSMKKWEEISDEPLPQSDAGYFDLLKPYYFGGRVQCFERGDIRRPFSVVDIRSAYPFAMLDCHPYGLDFSMCDRVKKSADIIPQALYKIEGESAGAFPLRNEVNGKLDFPETGEHIFTVTGWELQAALDTDTLTRWRILSRIEFSQCRDFRDYIIPYYNARLRAKADGDKMRDVFYKLLMNGLYGKFASDPRNYGTYTLHDIGLMSALMHPKSDETFAGMLGEWCLGYEPLSGSEARFYNVATSASITGFVRAYLWRNIKKCKGVLYCDTDSIACSVSNVRMGTELGEWDCEGEFDRACIAGRKLYAFRRVKPDKDGELWKVRSRGVRLNWREVMAVSHGKEIEYRPEVPTYTAKNRRKDARVLGKSSAFFNNRIIRMT